MKKKVSVKIWCKKCLQWLAHEIRYCPLFPKVAGTKRWDECVCLVHTCFDAKAAGIKRSKKTAPTYTDFTDAESLPGLLRSIVSVKSGGSRYSRG